MTNEQAERLSDLFATVLEVDPSAREAFLRQNCINDDERNAVQCLLAADKHLDGCWLDPLLDDVLQRGLFRETDRGYIGLVLQDRYTIVDHLGSGGTSLVYLAADGTLGDKCVVKVLRESAVDGDWFRKSFEQEIKTLILLKGHEGIVPVSDAGLTQGGQRYYVMPYVEGTTLKSEVCRGPMAFERVAGILRQIGAALTYAHVKGVCHLDLKPGNVFLKEIGDGGLHVSLIDFGTARRVSRSPGAAAEVSRVVGTPIYMAPEQFAGRPSAMSDQYAMGVIAFEMLTGQLPSEVDFEQLEAIKAGRHGQLSYALPMSTQRALARTLALDPKSRYESAAACGEEIARSLFNDAPWRLWDTIRAFLSGIWSRGPLRAVAILTLVASFVYLMIALFGPSGRVPPLPVATGREPAGSAGGNEATIQVVRDRVDELRDDYTVRRREFSTNLYWQCATALLGLLLAMRAGAPLKVRSMGLTIPVTWLCFALPAVLIYLWLEFGFLLDDLIKWRAEAWVELAKLGAISRASGFNDGGYLDGWFLAFRPTEHSIDPAFRGGAVFFFCLVYCPLFAIGHASAVVLPYFGARQWLDSSNGQARGYKALLCLVVPSALLIAAHLQFLLGGKNPNWMQPMVGVIVVVLCVYLLLHARHGRA
jgi:tRNA A-37 threonylcarbamoyl transferase component Bud32